MSQQSLDNALEQQKKTKELLGQVLVRMGVLTADDIKAPLLIQEQLRAIDSAVRMAAGERQLLGALLVESGHITSEQLDLVIAEQQRTGEKIGELFKRLGILTQYQLDALLDYQVNLETPHTSPLRLGELLVATGHITREQLEDALHRQALSNKKLGEVLVDAGYILPGCVRHGIRLQKMLVKAVLAAILSLGVAATTAYADSVPPNPETKTIMTRVLEESGEFSHLSAKEAELSRLVNSYREANGLPPVANSRSLNKVARMHAIDLVENRPADEKKDGRGLACSLHSWSSTGSWTPVCYTKDHAYAQAMWDKPREITNFVYTGDGYENAYATSEAEVTPAKVLKAWRASPSHNALILESGVWNSSNLLAFGIGIYKNVAVIWFGSMTDPLGPMQPLEIALK